MPGISMPCMSMPPEPDENGMPPCDMRASQSQASPLASSRKVATIRRSRSRIFASTECAWSGRSVSREVEHRNMGVAGREAQSDWTGGVGRPAGILRLVILESVRQLHPGAQLLTGHRVADRLHVGLDQAVDRNPPGPLTDVDFEMDRQEHRVMHLGPYGGEDVED